MDAAEVIRAVNAGAKVLRIEDSLYGARWDEDFRGWWLWKLVPGSEEHFVTEERCTCRAEKPCKHMRNVL